MEYVFVRKHPYPIFDLNGLVYWGIGFMKFKYGLVFVKVIEI